MRPRHACESHPLTIRRRRAAQAERMDEVLAAMSAIDTRTARATSKHDERMIREAVRASDGGFGTVNRLIHARLRDWLALQAARRVDTLSSISGTPVDAGIASAEHVIELSGARCTLAALRREQGAMDDLVAGEALCREALDGMMRAVEMTSGGGGRDGAQPEQPQHLLTLRCMHELGLVLHAQGRYRDAATHLRRVMHHRHCHPRLGRRHPDTLASMCALGAALVRCDEAPSAVRVLRQALRHMREADDGASERPETLRAMTLLACALRAEGERQQKQAAVAAADSAVSEAEQLLGEALVACRATLGPAHPVALDVMDEYASVLVHFGDVLQAQRMRRELQRARHEQLGRAHPAAVAADVHIVLELEREGRVEEAVRECMACLDSFSAALGKAHPQVSACAAHAQRMLLRRLDGMIDSGRGDEAARELVAFLVRLVPLVNANNLCAFATSAAPMLGRLAHRNRRDSFAPMWKVEGLLRRTLDIMSKALGAEHATTRAVLDAQDALLKAALGVMAKGHIDDKMAAEKVIRSVSTAIAGAMGDRHERALGAMFIHAQALVNLSKNSSWYPTVSDDFGWCIICGCGTPEVDDALDVMYRVLRLHDETLGADHPQTKEVEGMVSQLYNMYSSIGIDLLLGFFCMPCVCIGHLCWKCISRRRRDRQRAAAAVAARTASSGRQLRASAPADVAHVLSTAPATVDPM